MPKQRFAERLFLTGALLCLSFCAVLPATAQLSMQSLLARLQDDLQGHWQGVGPPGAISVRISGNTLRFFARDDFWYEATFTLKEASGRHELHATITDSSPPRKDIGEVVPAIVEVGPETLVLAVNDGSPTAPESLTDAMSRYELRRVEARSPLQ